MAEVNEYFKERELQDFKDWEHHIESLFSEGAEDVIDFVGRLLKHQNTENFKRIIDGLVDVTAIVDENSRWGYENVGLNDLLRAVLEPELK